MVKEGVAGEAAEAKLGEFEVSEVDKRAARDEIGAFSAEEGGFTHDQGGSEDFTIRVTDSKIERSPAVLGAKRSVLGSLEEILVGAMVHKFSKFGAGDFSKFHKFYFNTSEGDARF